MAWSENLDLDKCKELDVLPCSKDDLIKNSDFLSIHVQGGERYKDCFTLKEFDKMKKRERCQYQLIDQGEKKTKYSSTFWHQRHRCQHHLSGANPFQSQITHDTYNSSRAMNFVSVASSRTEQNTKIKS